LNRLAEALNAHKSGDLRRAERLYRKLIDQGRDLFHAKHLLGVLRFQCGHLEDANRLIRQAIVINSKDDAAHYNHGMVLAELNLHEDAITSFDAAIALNPKNAAAYNNRGVVLHALKQYDQAIASFDEAIALDTSFTEARNNRDKTLGALVVDGNVLFMQNRDDEALACYDKVIAAKSDHAEAHFNRGLLKLSLGEYAEGWQSYEWRWKMQSFTHFVRDYPSLWQGDADLSGKTILIHADQGMGDAIQIFRYLPLLRARNCRVLFEVHKPLVPLFRDHDIEVIARRDVPPPAEAFPPFDFHCPLFSLPLAFKTTLDTIPASVPYLAAQPDKVASWAALLGEKTKPRIGVVWSGNSSLPHDKARSMTLETLLPIMVDGVEWFSLQKDVRDYDREALGRAPLRDFTDTLNDFSDTAALISQLDVVISVDTSVAHLAGALGKPLWLLLSFHPDWRWLRDRTDSPWYSTAKLFRQSVDGEWADVLARVVECRAVQ
jgi:hypothetical protein